MTIPQYPFVCERCGEAFTDYYKYSKHLHDQIDAGNSEHLPRSSMRVLQTKIVKEASKDA